VKLVLLVVVIVAQVVVVVVIVNSTPVQVLGTVIVRVERVSMPLHQQVVRVHEVRHAFEALNDLLD